MDSRGTYIRGKFHVTKKIKNGYLVSTALELYHSYLNGVKVGDGEMAPGWTVYNEHLLYQTHDVTSLLRQGENVLGAHVGAGWYKGRMGFENYRNIYGPITAFWAQLLLRYEDGTEEIVATDESFLGCDSPVLFSEIYDGELYDARKEQKGWNQPGFDESGWRKVHRVEYPVKKLSSQTGYKVRDYTGWPSCNRICGNTGMA